MNISRLRRYPREERGAAIVEFAVMLPLVLLLVFGIVEFGLAFSIKLNVETAARSGARVGSGLRDDRMADYNLLQSVKSALNDNLSNVQYVVVYKSTNASGAIPAGCSGAMPISQNGSCNVYTGVQLSSLTAASFGGATCTAAQPDHFWCPTSRQAVQSVGNDYLGVLVMVKTSAVTQVFGSFFSVQANAVMQLEPKES
jgi:Flp pilus assembly protein TadG